MSPPQPFSLNLVPRSNARLHLTAPPSLHLGGSFLALWRDGYRFIENRCWALGADAFRTRFFWRKTICLSGPEAARLLQCESRFRRSEVCPAPTPRIWALERLTTPQIHSLADRLRTELLASLPGWSNHPRLRLISAVREILLQSVCSWAGISLSPRELRERAILVKAVIDGDGLIGPPRWRAHIAWARCERWLARTIGDARDQDRSFPQDALLTRIASHRDETGTMLPAKAAAAELFNVIRQVVALDRFIVFAALALYRYPESRDALVSGRIRPEAFAREVRRYYPFQPFLVARVRRGFVWHRWHFSPGRRVLFDLYGIQRDPRIWTTPASFAPERFQTAGLPPDPTTPPTGDAALPAPHSPNEALALALMQQIVQFLVHDIRYDVPPQDLTISLRRMPARPASGLVIENIHPLVTIPPAQVRPTESSTDSKSVRPRSNWLASKVR